MNEELTIKQLLDRIEALEREVYKLRVLSTGKLYFVDTYGQMGMPSYETIFAGASEQECTEWVLANFGELVEIDSLNQIAVKGLSRSAGLWGRVKSTSYGDYDWQDAYNLFVSGGVSAEAFPNQAA